MRKLLFAALLSVTPSAHAELVAGIGTSVFAKAGNGTWFQNEYLHELNMRSTSATLRYDFGDNSIGYMYVGKVTSSALAKASDQAYNMGKPYPLSQWYGSGDTQGLFASHRFTSGNWYATLGLMAYRSTWEVDIPDWRPCVDWQTQCYVADTPRPLHVQHKTVWRTYPMAGAGYQNGKWAAELNVLPADAQGDEFPAVYRSVAGNFSILRKF